MERLVALSIVVAISWLCHASPQKLGIVKVENGQVGIGAITGGQFSPGSFSINAPGNSNPADTPYMSYESDGPITINNPANNGEQQIHDLPPQPGINNELNHTGGDYDRGDTQTVSAPSQRALANQGHGGQGGRGGTGDGQIVIGSVINKHNNRNKRQEEPGLSVARALEAIFGSNNENNGYPYSESEYSGNGSGRSGSIQIGSVTGGSFGPETSSASNKKPTGTNKAQNGEARNNENSGYTNTDNQAPYIGHDANSHGGTDVANRHDKDQITPNRSNEDEDVWVWSS